MAEELKSIVSNNLAPLSVGMVLRTKRHAYRILEQINRGGFGITYRVENLQDFLVGARRDRTGNVVDSGVVVKKGTILVLKECCHDGSMMRLPGGKLRLTDKEKGANIRRQFYDEAVALTRLLYQVPSSRFAHLMSGFVPIYHAGTLVSINGKPDYEADNSVYLVMPMLDGGSFHDVRKNGMALKNGQRVTAQHYAYWLYLLLNGLQHVHANDKVHRDIKPANIMLTGTQQAVLIDFGAIAETRRGAVVNQRTPDFASPEQMDGFLSGDLDGRSDLYSLALTFYVMLTGTNPQSRLHPAKWRKLSEDEKLVSLFDKVSFQVEGCERTVNGFGKRFLMGLEKGLFRNRDARWASARDWRDAVYNRLMPCAPTVGELGENGGDYGFTSTGAGSKPVGGTGGFTGQQVTGKNGVSGVGGSKGTSTPSSSSKSAKVNRMTHKPVDLAIYIVAGLLLIVIVILLLTLE